MFGGMLTIILFKLNSMSMYQVNCLFYVLYTQSNLWKQNLGNLKKKSDRFFIFTDLTLCGNIVWYN